MWQSITGATYPVLLLLLFTLEVFLVSLLPFIGEPCQPHALYC
jgi:hypothetical protein